VQTFVVADASINNLRQSKTRIAEDRLKVGKIITSVGPKGLKQLGQTRPTLRKETFNWLTTGRVYVLDPNKIFTPAG
jgi:hypothetical protein